MKLLFPYGIRFRENGHLEIFPVAELSVIGWRGRGIRALFHLDSGATTSILPASDAPALGMELSTGKRMIVRGIGDASLIGYRHIARFQFNGLTMRAPVIFVEHISVPRILGREGIFPHFAIIFDEARRRIGFLERKIEKKAIERMFA